MVKMHLWWIPYVAKVHLLVSLSMSKVESVFFLQVSLKRFLEISTLVALLFFIIWSLMLVFYYFTMTWTWNLLVARVVLTLKNRWSENSKKPWQELTIIRIINYPSFASFLTGNCYTFIQVSNFFSKDKGFLKIL